MIKSKVNLSNSKQDFLLETNLNNDDVNVKVLEYSIFVMKEKELLLYCFINVVDLQLERDQFLVLLLLCDELDIGFREGDQLLDQVDYFLLVVGVCYGTGEVQGIVGTDLQLRDEYASFGGDMAEDGQIVFVDADGGLCNTYFEDDDQFNTLLDEDDDQFNTLLDEDVGEVVNELI
ncbi:MAG: hypothetical protein EZS28_041564 [Streblomastix strix]|uniref:Uncharacterized protein n=1 Tax=Streblomastix strix TaxID=222440 RepID=A0A5J4TXV3_9EUKA|nr:MAG: hypothetical protein EZS28_041564 [Streblomastix strix]